MHAPPRRPSRALRSIARAAHTLLLFGLAVPANAETPDGPRPIATPPLKLIGDGAAPPAPPRQDTVTIATPPLRLVGDGAKPPGREAAPTTPLTIETRPLKLIGAKP
jgi:hypothetical protein